MSFVNIKYNDKILASTNENRTLTLKCQNKLMEEDLIIEIKEESLSYELFVNNKNENAYKITGLGNIIDKKIIIPNTYNNRPIELIDNNAFEWGEMFSIDLCDTITAIGQKAFYCCTKLVSIDLLKVKSIGDAAFESCKSLKNIYISNVLTSIGNDVFIHCDNLQTVYFKGSISQWNKIKNHFPEDIQVILI